MFKLFILTKNGMLSVNQTVAQIKLTELWKATHTDNNPLKFTQIAPAENGRNSRAVTNKKLYQRLYALKRLKNHLPSPKIRNVAESLWTSKLRYGLQIWANVRLTEDQPSHYLAIEAQKAQNNLLRTLCNKKLSDRENIGKMLQNQNMLSVNQMAAQIKLCEMWKAKNVEEYPIKFKYQSTQPGARETRGNATGRMIETGRSIKTITSFVGDAPRIWNRAPIQVTSAKTLSTAKKEIRKFCLTLPI